MFIEAGQVGFTGAPSSQPGRNHGPFCANQFRQNLRSSCESRPALLAENGGDGFAALRASIKASVSRKVKCHLFGEQMAHRGLPVPHGPRIHQCYCAHLPRATTTDLPPKSPVGTQCLDGTLINQRRQMAGLGISLCKEGLSFRTRVFA